MCPGFQIIVMQQIECLSRTEAQIGWFWLFLQERVLYGFRELPQVDTPIPSYVQAAAHG
jgi:hypothetical protein